MSVEERSYGGGAPERSWTTALRHGLALKCPCCGEDRLLRGWLKVRPSCGSCGLDYSGHRADDLPPYLTILVVGHLMIPGVLFLERAYAPPAIVSVLILSSLAIVISALLLPRMKGAVIGIQWANEMHGFGDGDGWAERPAPDPRDDVELAPSRRVGD